MHAAKYPKNMLIQRLETDQTERYISTISESHYACLLLTYYPAHAGKGL